MLLVLVIRRELRVERQREQPRQLGTLVTHALYLLDETLTHPVATTVAIPLVAPVGRAHLRLWVIVLEEEILVNLTTIKARVTVVVNFASFYETSEDSLLVLVEIGGFKAR